MCAKSHDPWLREEHATNNNSCIRDPGWKRWPTTKVLKCQLTQLQPHFVFHNLIIHPSNPPICPLFLPFSPSFHALMPAQSQRPGKPAPSPRWSKLRRGGGGEAPADHWWLNCQCIFQPGLAATTRVKTPICPFLSSCKNHQIPIMYVHHCVPSHKSHQCVRSFELIYPLPKPSTSDAQIIHPYMFAGCMYMLHWHFIFKNNRKYGHMDPHLQAKMD